MEPHQNGPGPVVVPAGHQDVEEDPLLAGLAVVVEGAGVVVRLRTLDQGDLGVVEPADGVGQERRHRDVVAVQHGDDVDRRRRRRPPPAAIRASAWFMLPALAWSWIVAADVAGAVLPAHLVDPGPVAVVQHPGLVRRLQRHRRGDGRRDHLDRLVVGGDEDGDPLARPDLVHRLRSGAVDVPQRDGAEDHPGQGTASNATRSQAATRFQPASGRVNPIRQTR